jgi:uncharacterized protein YraI
VLDGGSVPVENGQPQTADPTPTGNALRVSANLSLRSGPSLSDSRLTVVPNGTAVEIVGRNASRTWWQVTYGSRTGWVSGQYVILSADMNWDAIPVTANN